jgi:chemotaxis regulatin CheY-phosphate phosphatase CheZ
VTDERFIRVPARTRQEIGELTLYLEQGLKSLRQVTEHLRGSSGTMPGVLDDLRDVMRMTEAATERVLDETEALVDDGRAAARLVADVRHRAAAADAVAIAEPMQKLGALIARSNDRAMEIMSALEFQDLTSQKVQRTFAVLEEVLVRLGKIQRLVDADGATAAVARPAPPPPALDGKSAQRLADELLLLHHANNMDV